MRITRPRLGLLEWGILAAAVVLIGAEAAAIVAGLGPVFAVIVLGYFLALGAIYWVYRRENGDDGGPNISRQGPRGTPPVTDRPPAV